MPGFHLSSDISPTVLLLFDLASASPGSLQPSKVGIAGVQIGNPLLHGIPLRQLLLNSFPS